MFCIDNVSFSESENAKNGNEDKNRSRNQYYRSLQGEHFSKEIM